MQPAVEATPANVYPTLSLGACIQLNIDIGLAQVVLQLNRDSFRGTPLRTPCSDTVYMQQ
jgi:hypothetical protein